MPTPRHSPFQTIEPEARRAINMLVPLLRIADSLDRSHEQRIGDLQVQLRNGTVTLALDSNPDPDLEVWAVERVADTFRDAYQMQLQLTKVRP
jgi:exopolyphosphatase/guanosine-5'-triphosphate,3'-diphosphate pyrophosphatase